MQSNGKRVEDSDTNGSYFRQQPRDLSRSTGKGCHRPRERPHRCGFLARPSRSTIAILAERPSLRVITVDLAGVPYIETSGIATLVEALRIGRHRQTIVCLQGLSGSVLRLFEVAGVLPLFEAGDCKEKVS